jgi:hypothetical protein
VVRRCLRPAPSPDGEVPPPLIVVAGEPGIGKSSVVQEDERIARGHGCQVYEGRCFDGNLSPFQPFVEIVRQLIAELKLQERREALTWGVARPVVRLPDEAKAWPEPTRRLVLLHELAHVRRLDAGLLLAGRLVLAVY